MACFVCVRNTDIKYIMIWFTETGLDRGCYLKEKHYSAVEFIPLCKECIQIVKDLDRVIYYNKSEFIDIVTS